MTENPARQGDQPPPPPRGAPPGTAPGPGLAQALAAAAGGDGAGLGSLSDSELIEMITGGRRMSSWSAWIELAAMAEYGSRHPAGKGDPGPFTRGAADEIGFATRMTWTSAADRMTFAASAATRLPATFKALRDGSIDALHARIIEEYTAVLSPEDAAKADQILAAAAATLTPGQLRARAARVVLRLDPEAAQRRRESARRDASVRAYREESGNAGISGRELPADEVLASFQNIEQRALDLRAMGVEGSIRELKVLAMLDLLQERDSTLRRTAPAQDTTGQAAQDQDMQNQQDAREQDAQDQEDAREQDAQDQEDAQNRAAGDQAAPDQAGTVLDPAEDEESGDGEDDGNEPPSGGTGRSGPLGPAGTGGSGRSGGASGTRLAAQVTIVIPWQAWLGQPSGPGEASGFGLIDGPQIQDLLAAAAADPNSRGCVTVLGPDGTAIAHGCGRGPLTLPTIGTNQGEPDGRDPPGDHKPAGPSTQVTSAKDMIRGLKITLAPLTRGLCDHRAQEPGRLPSRNLRHLIRARNPQCTAPGCGRPAIGCEQDHTIAWEDDGITCECNLGPLCKHHHIIKHLNGWLLRQPEPGTFTWRTPAGRTYTTQPTPY
ncbi:MAG TPA: DUF222 domain-containing protein [Streptosporangiaceae bacterium]|nr:DUF222 domain-containing protein [Streptosporangiaceae bacterium]